MKKKLILILTSAILSVGVISFALVSGNYESNYARAKDDPFSLNLSNLSNNKTVLNTTNGNPIEFEVSGYNDGTFSSDSYIKNITPISGIESIIVSFVTNDTDLTISYSWYSDEFHSIESVINSSSNIYYFDYSGPSFFKIENKSGDAIITAGMQLAYSCSETNEPVPDDIASQAVELAKTGDLAFISRRNYLYPGTPTEIGHVLPGIWNNDYLYLTTRQSVDIDESISHRVKISWEPNVSSAIKQFAMVNDTHAVMFFDYSETEEINVDITATLSLGNISEEISYSVTLLTKNIKYTELSLDEIYSVAEDGLDFDIVDRTTGRYKSTNENYNFACVETCGKVLYASVDGNWALIGSGNRVLELYSGSSFNLSSSYFPDFAVGKSIRVGGELNAYYGNGQLSFISYIYKCNESDYDPITDMYSTLSGEDFYGKAYYENELMNGLFSATAVYKGNLKVGGYDATVDQMVKGRRATFDAEIGGRLITIEYDYHTDDKWASEQPLLDTLKTKLNSISVGDSFTIKGTVRYAGYNNGASRNTYKNQPVGTWSIVPFLPEHIS